MARNDWAALLTEPAAEYLAQTELQRFGITPYLPQQRRRFQAKTGKFMMRQYPLFPRYLLISIGDINHNSIRLCRGINKLRPILADDDGRPWRAPERVIHAIRTAESRGDFDEILHKGDPVTLHCGVLATIRAVISTDVCTGTLELLTPLFGGSRVRVDPGRIGPRLTA
jgi:hypothetical protein